MLAVGESRGGGGWHHGSVTLERSRSASPPSDFDRRHCRGRPEDRGADRSCPAPGPGRPRFEATVGGGYHGDQLGWRRADRLLGLRTSSGLVLSGRHRKFLGSHAACWVSGGALRGSPSSNDASTPPAVGGGERLGESGGLG